MQCTCSAHAVYLGEDGDERDGHAGHARQHGAGTEQRKGARREAWVDVRLPQQLTWLGLGLGLGLG